MHLKLGNVPVVVASSADTARAFLKTHDLDCCSRPPLTSLNRLSYGFNDIAFSPYGGQWRELRKVCIIELFSSKKVLSFRPIRQEEVDRMVGSIASQTDAVDLSEELMSLANHITCRQGKQSNLHTYVTYMAAVGKRYHAPGEGSRLKRILAETEALFMGFFFEDYFPLLGWLDRLTGMRARLERNFSELDGLYQEVIDEHKDPAWRREEDRGEDAIDALLSIQRSGANLTDEHIKGVLMNIFVAGSDTSSASVEWTMAELMRHPSVMKKAQEEVRSIVGKKGKVEESDLDRLYYLKCVLKEGFRVHPIVPLLVQRETIQHCRVNGYDIPAKTRLLVNMVAIGRDASVWERPEEFDPERFVGSAIDIRGHDFELIPFGAGRRICPGMGVGILVVELALANLLYSFDWELPEGTTKEDIDMSEAPGITVHRKSHLRLVAKRV
ncbi:cytochrome P450 71A9-like [Iris pallida]|uniref:Cytochrome P450 71A9-like n=1 Tax=Iris pallida TaxID=29817 RepID=A0AAX6DP92_IRIPA|nr:cytochrome P450 71A9-like [Iris pallida]